MCTTENPPSIGLDSLHQPGYQFLKQNRKKSVQSDGNISGNSTAVGNFKQDMLMYMFTYHVK